MKTPYKCEDPGWHVRIPSKNRAYLRHNFIKESKRPNPTRISTSGTSYASYDTIVKRLATTVVKDPNLVVPALNQQQPSIPKLRPVVKKKKKSLKNKKTVEKMRASRMRNADKLYYNDRSKEITRYKARLSGLKERLTTRVNESDSAYRLARSQQGLADRQRFSKPPKQPHVVVFERAQEKTLIGHRSTKQPSQSNTTVHKRSASDVSFARQQFSTKNRYMGNKTQKHRITSKPWKRKNNKQTTQSWRAQNHVISLSNGPTEQDFIQVNLDTQTIKDVAFVDLL